jgi:hypothetical protein
MAADARYFELNDDVGLAPQYITGKDGEPVVNPAAGSPEPLHHMSLTVGVPTQVGDDILTVPQTVDLTGIPGTRIIKVDDVLVANAMAGHPLFHETEAPSQKDLKAARSTTEDARAASEEV